MQVAQLKELKYSDISDDGVFNWQTDPICPVEDSRLNNGVYYFSMPLTYGRMAAGHRVRQFFSVHGFPFVGNTIPLENELNMSLR